MNEHLVDGLIETVAPAWLMSIEPAEAIRDLLKRAAPALERAGELVEVVEERLPTPAALEDRAQPEHVAAAKIGDYLLGFIRSQYRFEVFERQVSAAGARQELTETNLASPRKVSAETRPPNRD